MLDKFFDEEGTPIYKFDGFSSTTKQVYTQGRAVKSNPPSRLMWYFETPRFRRYMLPVLTEAGVPSVCTG
ncbi:Tox-REase-5 domain-containing protein [Paraburkholderia sp. Ac-20340]|uniref:Tox-REase-5 domain-containing protein n=1 Tax=Paraburkholderia sp. Ac-20340 TaxID=2703888 RepID=UPI001F120375|nr:Tox-REase-5 domain-containing protein [Paraburkholderia sp. Ac-20340]